MRRFFLSRKNRAQKNWGVYKSIIYKNIQGDSPIIMSPTEMKMQPTIHLERNAG
jgi:hypothetical protein